MPEARFARYLAPKHTELRMELERYLVFHNTDRGRTGRWTKRQIPETSIGNEKM